MGSLFITVVTLDQLPSYTEKKNLSLFFFLSVRGKMFFAHVKIDRKLMLGILVPLLGYGLGSALDRTETNRMVMFR